MGLSLKPSLRELYVPRDTQLSDEDIEEVYAHARKAWMRQTNLIGRFLFWAFDWHECNRVHERDGSCYEVSRCIYCLRDHVLITDEREYFSYLGNDGTYPELRGPGPTRMQCMRGMLEAARRARDAEG